MPLSPDLLDQLASRLHEAARAATPIPQLTTEHSGLTLDEAYTIQRALIGLRKIEGFDLVGRKMGLTSKAKMVQVGVHEPIYGHLTKDMQLLSGETLSHARFCHPRVEPEIAFIMGRDLEGPCSAAEAMAAVEATCCALEVIDSRYRDFKFELTDVVADNASSSAFVLSDTLVPVGGVDLGNRGMVMEVNGEPKQIGSSAAIYEHPARSLATLAALIAERGEKVQAGDVVLAGGATAAVALSPGDRVRLRVDGMGTAELRVG